MDRKPPRRRGYAAPILATLAVIGYAIGMIALLFQGLVSDQPCTTLALWLGFYMLVGVAVICGAVYCLRQRIREIQGGEEDEADQY